MQTSDLSNTIYNQYTEFVNHFFKCQTAAISCTSQRKYAVMHNNINFDVRVAFEAVSSNQDNPLYAFKVTPPNADLDKTLGEALKKIQRTYNNKFVQNDTVLGPRFGAHNT